MRSQTLYSDRRGSASKRLLLGFTLMLLVPALLLFLAWLLTIREITPVYLLSPPVIAAEGDSARIYLLTGQIHRYRLTSTGRRFNSSTIITNLYVDLWAIDAASMKPLWRNRLQTERNGAMSDRTLLGVDRGVVWLLMQGELVAVSAEEGDVIAPVGRIAGDNPELGDLMPAEPRFFTVDAHGLRITAADARAWRIEPQTLRTTEDATPGDHVGSAFSPLFTRPDATELLKVRGIDIPGFWLGLLTDEEARAFEEENQAGDLSRETRRRLWGGKAATATNFFGEYLDYTDLKPLPESPEYLDAGLLREYREGVQLPALWMRDPDSVFVLHRDRIGAAGPLRLTRVAGPEGRAVWDAALPLTSLQAVKRAGGVLVLLGEDQQNSEKDTFGQFPQRLVSVNLETGALQVHRNDALDTHPRAQPADIRG